MVEVQLGVKTIDLPYAIWVYGVTEEAFDELVDEDTKAELIDTACPACKRLSIALRLAEN